MMRSKNKHRHKWIDDGKHRGIELYTYTCGRCGKKRIKNDSFSMSYYDDLGNLIGNRAPECVPFYTLPRKLSSRIS